MKAKRRDKRECKISLVKVSFLKKSLVTAILVISVLAMLTAVASATDYYVRTGGLDDASHDGLANTDARAWKTISYAIGGAEVIDGDTIHVAAGEYADNIGVSKRLTLQGEGRDVVTVTAKLAGDYVFDVSQNYVNISGFTATGATGDWKAGIYLGSSNHCNISDNYAYDNFIGIFLHSSSSNNLSGNYAYDNSNHGILLYSSSNYNNLSGNYAYNNSGIGIFLHSSSSNNLSGNNAYDNSDYGILLQSSSNYNNLLGNNAYDNSDEGIRLHSSSNNNLSGNYAYNNSDVGIWLYSSSNNNLSGNYAYNNSDVGIELWYSSNNNLSGNNAYDNFWCGIRLSSSCNNELTNNTANSNSRYGIYLDNADDNNITCNWVAHNDQRGFDLDGGSTGNNISYNNIMHNGELQPDGSYHWNFYNYQDVVDAKHNYWVATTNETIAASIYEGTGKVTFYPFLEQESPCAPIPEAATIILLSIGLVVLAGYVWRRNLNKSV